MRKHKLGFFVIPLLRIGSYRAALHWWPPGQFDPDIHSHRWDFTSVLLWGSLHETRYELALKGLGWDAYRCLPGCKPDAKPFGEYAVAQVTDTVRRAPCAYSGTRHEFHQAGTGTGGALTLFIQRRKHEEDHSIVLRKHHP